MDINSVYNFLLYIVRKNRGVFVTVEDAMSALHSGQMIKFETDFAGYGVNQAIHDSLKPFLISNFLFTSNSGGFVTFESNYAHFLNGAFTVYGSTVNTISFVSVDELPDALTSQLRPISTSNPIAIDTPTGFKLYPERVHAGCYSYLKLPTKPVLAYDQTGRVLTYNAAASTQLEWGQTYYNAVMSKALQFLGINMDENGIIQFSVMYNKETQI